MGFLLVLASFASGHLWRGALLFLAALPFVYYAVATFAAVRFFGSKRQGNSPNFTPPISVLKPLRGVDFGSYENFASFCRQDYPDYEILFGVNDESEPAVPLLHRLMNEFPKTSIRLIIGAEYLGANRKVNMLARLASEAAHEVIVLTDGDVRVGPNYLREVATSFANGDTLNEKVGAVTSFYRGVAERNLGAQLEAVGAASDFFPGVLLAGSTEQMSFALGAAIATTKSWLARIGGFAAIANMHSDDYELGNRIAKAGGHVVLSRETVWTMYPAQNFRSFWDHQLRWARTVRLCRPLSYLGLLFTQGLPWTILAALLAPQPWIAVVYVMRYVVLRFLVAWTVGVWGVRDDVLHRKLWLIPLYDAVHFFVWLASFASNRIVWGGEVFIMRGGHMVPENPTQPLPSQSRLSG